MALPVHLLDEVMRLPERDRLELVEHILAGRQDAGDDHVADRAALLAALERSRRDVEAGRTRPAAELIASLRATTP